MRYFFSGFITGAWQPGAVAGLLALGLSAGCATIENALVDDDSDSALAAEREEREAIYGPDKNYEEDDSQGD